MGNAERKEKELNLLNSYRYCHLLALMLGSGHCLTTRGGGEEGWLSYPLIHPSDVPQRPPASPEVSKLLPTAQQGKTDHCQH